MTQPPDGPPGDSPGAPGPAPGWLRPPPPPVTPPPIGGSGAGDPPAAPGWTAPSGPVAPEPGWGAPPAQPPTAGPSGVTPSPGFGPDPSGPVALEQTTTVSRRSNRGLLAVGLVAMLGGLGFAVVNLASSGGSDSPEAAVGGMLDSLNDEDVIGVLESLRPAERDALRGPIEESVTELERLDLLADVDLTGLQGVDIELEGYQLLTTELGDGVTAVTVTGGTVSGAATPQELPIGGTLREILEEDLDVEIPEGTEASTEDLGEFQLVAVRDGGSWYVSPGYSFAEWARQEAEAPLPSFDGSVVPVGGESPEASVRALAQAAVDFDAEAAITQLDPEEMAALYDYAPLFLDDADQAADEALNDAEVSFELTDLAVEDGPDGTKRVLIEGFDLSVGYDGEYDEGSYEVSFDGECFEYEYESTYYYDYYDDYDEEYDFGSDRESETETDSGEWCEGQPMLDDDGEEIVMPSLDTAFDQFAVVTVERDGRWYVAPTRSILSVIPTALRGVEPADIDEMREWFRDFWGGDAFFGTEMEFEEIGEAIDGSEGTFEEISPGIDEGPIDQCYVYDEGQPWESDPRHANPTEDRTYYLQELAFRACVDDLVASGEITEDEAESWVYVEDCWAAYEALAPDATAEQWSAADLQVAACYEEQWADLDGMDEELEETTEALGELGDLPLETSTYPEFLEELGADEEVVACIDQMLVDEFGEERMAELREGADLLGDDEFMAANVAVMMCVVPGFSEADMPPTTVG